MKLNPKDYNNPIDYAEDQAMLGELPEAPDVITYDDLIEDQDEAIAKLFIDAAISKILKENNSA